jgi:quinol monooxygenase YgiN
MTALQLLPEYHRGIMIIVIIRMKVLSEKRRELSQTIASLCDSTSKEKGCRRCDFCCSVDDENHFFLLEECDTEASLMTHQKTEQFKVFRGAMNLLKEPYERMSYAVFQTAEKRAI